MEYFQVYRLSSDIIWVDFDTQVGLTTTLLRFQEHYEGKYHAGTIFTLDAYKEYYIKEHGAFTYYTDWNGFNFPGHILLPFHGGMMDPLSDAESSFLDAMEAIKLPSNSYIIGTHSQKSQAYLKHETAHALFCVDSKYRAEVLEILTRVDLNPIFRALSKHEYGSGTWVDECHAYLLEDLEQLRRWGVDTNPYLSTSSKLQIVYNRHSAKLAFNPLPALAWGVNIG